MLAFALYTLEAQQLPAANSSIFGEFVGSSPYSDHVRRLLAFSAEPGDEDHHHRDAVKAKWRLTLYQDPGTGAPTTYKVEGSLYRQTPRKSR
jgi:hypothetical protein